MVVLRVGLEMLGQGVDALGEDRDLDFGRTGVVLAAGMFLDQLLLLRSAVIDIVSLLFVSKVEPADDLAGRRPKLRPARPDVPSVVAS